MASNLSALDRLRKAANLEPIKKEVTLSDGSIFEMYVSPLTMAERERAQRQARSDDANAFAIATFILASHNEFRGLASMELAAYQTCPARTLLLPPDRN